MPTNDITDTLEGFETMKATSDDPRVIEIVEEVLQQVRYLLTQFEEFVYEVWDLVQMIGELFAEVKNLFRGQQKEMAPEAV